MKFEENDNDFKEFPHIETPNQWKLRAENSRANYQNDHEKSDRHHRKNTLNSCFLLEIKKRIKK